MSVKAAKIRAPTAGMGHILNALSSHGIRYNLSILKSQPWLDMLMASYTVRVELKEQTEKMRIDLQFTMLENGFSRSVVCDRGFTYALPTNEFVYVGSEGIKNLMDRIVSLISDISDDPSVLITRSEERCWSGLRIVDLG